MATNYERMAGTPERLVQTFSPADGECLMEHLGYDCTDDACVVTRCPIYSRNRIKTCEQNMLEWLQEECDD